MCGKNLRIYDVHIPRKCIKSRNFYSSASPLKTYPTSCCHHTIGRGKLLIPTGSIFFQKSVSPTAETGGAKYDLLYQNSIKKMKMTCYIRLFIFCMICNFFKCHGLTVL